MVVEHPDDKNKNDYKKEFPFKIEKEKLM